MRETHRGALSGGTESGGEISRHHPVLDYTRLMRNHDFDWRRYWYPRDLGATPLIADGDYLPDPEAGVGRYMNPHVVASEAVLEKPCVVLLGEPGIGKSTELRRLKQGLELDRPSSESLSLDLNSISEEYSLDKDLLESSAVHSWRRDQGRLRVVLDSFDECMLRLETVSNRLAGWLEHVPTERLQLVIACRTMSWPMSLERTLMRYWSKEQMGIYELLPLRRVDIEIACKAEGVDASDFLQAVDASNVGSFAAKPLTLLFLLGEYTRKQELPESRTELYRKSLEYLCEESNLSRQETGRTGALEPHQRLTVASRIAGVAQLCGRTTIWTSSALDKADTSLSLTDLTGDEAGISVTSDVLKEVLDTGLFSARGNSAMGWAHQSYADFLAGFWLHENQVPRQQALGLLTDPDAGLLIPQLAATAAWLASRDTSLFDEIVEIDPLSLLHGDVSVFAAPQRELLVDRLLQRLAEGDVEDPWRIIRARPGRLRQPRLAAQLRPVVRDKSESSQVRQIAISIATAAKAEEISDALLEIALDPEDEPHVRGSAASALGVVGNRDARLQLKRLLTEEASTSDPEDEIRGGALKALWPDAISPEQLIEAIEAPKRRNLVGAYHTFLIFDLPDRATPDTLPVLLAWVADNVTSNLDAGISVRDRAMQRILRAAVAHLGNDRVRQSFVEAVVARCRAHKQVFDENYLKPQRLPVEDRRRVVQAILEGVGDAGAIEESLLEPGRRSQLLLDGDDIDWLIQELSGIPDAEKRRGVLRVVRALWTPPSSTHQADTILDLVGMDPVAAEEFRYWIATIDFASEAAEEQRARYKRYNARQTSSEGEFAEEIAEKVEHFLSEIEKANLDAWWRLNVELVRDPSTGRYFNGNEVESDLTQLPAWSVLPKESHNRVVTGAQRYVEMWKPDYDDLWKSSTQFRLIRPLFAGYRGLCLLATEMPAALDSLSSDTWARWARMIVDYPNQSEPTERRRQRQLLSKAYVQAPKECLRALQDAIDRCTENDHPVTLLDLFEECWDSRLEDLLCQRVEEASLPPDTYEDLVTRLLQRRVLRAQEAAESLVLSAFDENKEVDELAIRAAAVLLASHRAGEIWPLIWPILEVQPTLGERILKAYFRDTDSRQVPTGLSEDEFADLYLWLLDRLPPEEEGEFWNEEGYFGSVEHELREFRSALLTSLKTKATTESYSAIQRIVDAKPEYPWLNEHLAAARKRLVEASWKPPTPEELFELLRRSERRLVRTGGDLVDAVIESIERYQDQFHGETPVVTRFWHEPSTGRWRPKDEANISNELTHHLRQELETEGVVASREVEIRPGTATGTGQETDIHVDVVRSGSEEEPPLHLKVVVEVKGCWNRSVKSDMKEQLFKRYLHESDCNHGLYVVGWFLCDRWDSDDYRKNTTPSWQIDEAQRFFDEQARELSSIGQKMIRSLVLDLRLRDL